MHERSVYDYHTVPKKLYNWTLPESIAESYRILCYLQPLGYVFLLCSIIIHFFYNNRVYKNSKAQNP